VDTGACRPGCDCLDCYTTEAINMSSIWTPLEGSQEDGEPETPAALDQRQAKLGLGEA
jgi:hypothetical protein